LDTSDELYRVLYFPNCDDPVEGGRAVLYYGFYYSFNIERYVCDICNEDRKKYLDILGLESMFSGLNEAVVWQ